MTTKQIIIKKAEEDVENLESMINSFENLVYKLEGPSERINGESGVWSLPIKSSIPLSNYLPPNTYNSNYHYVTVYLKHCGKKIIWIDKFYFY